MLRSLAALLLLGAAEAWHSGTVTPLARLAFRPPALPPARSRTVAVAPRRSSAVVVASSTNSIDAAAPPQASFDAARIAADWSVCLPWLAVGGVAGVTFAAVGEVTRDGVSSQDYYLPQRLGSPPLTTETDCRTPSTSSRAPRCRA